jgi:hypothetical protein
MGRGIDRRSGVIFAVEAGVVSTDSFGEQLLVWLKGGFG